MGENQAMLSIDNIRMKYADGLPFEYRNSLKLAGPSLLDRSVEIRSVALSPETPSTSGIFSNAVAMVNFNDRLLYDGLKRVKLPTDDATSSQFFETVYRKLKVAVHEIALVRFDHDKFILDNIILELSPVSMPCFEVVFEGDFPVTGAKISISPLAKRSNTAGDIRSAVKRLTKAYEEWKSLSESGRHARR
jgi:hypothetical protein